MNYQTGTWGKIRKNGLKDKRYRVNKTLAVKEQTFWQLHGSMICTIILGAIAGLILGQSLWVSTHKPLLNPKGQGIIKIQVIEAAAPIVTPTQSPNRRYQKYSSMPKYEYIISELQMLYVNWEDAADLNSYENGFDPMAINPTSGACGLSQALPCSKLTCELGDIKCDLKWQKDYISDRYGTVTKALQFHHVNNWY